MRKPHIAELVPFFYICQDVGKMHGTLQSTIDQFYEHVVRRAETRGWKQLMLLDLPKIGSAFDSSLSRGYIVVSEFPASAGCSRIDRFQDSWIYRSLLHTCVDTFGVLDQDIPVEIVTGIRQLLSFYKKTRLKCPPEATRSAVDDFISIEKDLRCPALPWNHDWFSHTRLSFRDSDELVGNLPNDFWATLDKVCHRMVPGRVLHSQDIVPKHGPGAVSDVRTGFDKFSANSWPNKLEGYFPQDLFRYHSEEVATTEKILSFTEEPASLIAVPKTYKGPRLIASEPTFHQFLQQGLLDWIRQNMTGPARQCISFHDQEPSRVAAIGASLHGQSATVDLSSASDRLSCWVVERVFNSNPSLLAALHSVRTRVIVDKTGADPDLSMRIKKFAAQGSAVTFPVQTIVYSSIAIAALLHAEKKPVTSKTMKWATGRIQVFGDDIITPSSSFATLVVALTDLQLKVNVNKSHYLGHFRESCGMDAYHGHDVTPIYMGDILPPDPKQVTRIASWIDISNLLHAGGMWKTAEWMISELPKSMTWRLLYTPDAGPGFRAFSYCRGLRFHGRRRWNNHHQRQELNTLDIKSVVKKKARGTFDDLLQYFLEKPAPDVVWKPGFIEGCRDTIVSRWVHGG